MDIKGKVREKVKKFNIKTETTNSCSVTSS